MAQTDKTLSPEQVKQLKDAMARIPQIKAMIAKAKLAKIDVSSHEAVLKDLEEKVRAMHNVYVLGKTTGE